MKSLLLRRQRGTATFFYMLVFTGCASVSPSKVVENPYVTDGASEEAATVTFIRVHSFFGGGVAIPVYLNAELAVKMRTETYVTLSILPGRYDISTGKDRMDWPGVDEAKAYHGDLVFLPSETYFILLYQEQYGVRRDPQMGVDVPEYWIRFEIIEIDEANKHMSGYEFIPLNAD